MNSFTKWLLPCGLSMSLLTVPSYAQVQSSRLHTQLDRISGGISGIGTFTQDVSGANYLGQNVTQHASTTLGVLLNVQYVRSPLLGIEGNVSYARYTQHFNIPPLGGAQNNVSEFSLGYVAHTHFIFGVTPFGALGLGSLVFSPTAAGGQGLLRRARASYYYGIGADLPVNAHFGVRAQVRQVFYKAPDFGANYLVIQQHTTTVEPALGVYLHF